MSLYPFPNVPALPGVPALPRSPLFPPAATIGLGLVEGVLFNVLQTRFKWGIFDTAGKALGNPAQIFGLPANILNAIGIGAVLSTNAVDYRKEMRVSDFPVEKGGFASYNKVELPATPIVTLCFDGGESDRTTFLNAIDAATKSTRLYNVVTPEIVYVGYTLNDYRYERRAVRGTTLLLVQIDLTEVRQVSAVYTTQVINQPKNPGATSAANSGVVQPQAPSTSILSKAASAIWNFSGKVATFLVGK